MGLGDLASRDLFLQWVPWEPHGVGPKAHGPPLPGGEIHSREARGVNTLAWAFPDGPPLILGVSLVVRYIGSRVRLLHGRILQGDQFTCNPIPEY